MVNKRGWLRILEAVMAVMILGSIILVVFNRQVPNINQTDYISDIQTGVLSKILSNLTLYNFVLAGDELALEDFVNTSVLNTQLNHSVRICDLTNPVTSCILEESISDILVDHDVYVKEVIVSANLTTYSPKKVRLFTWVN